MPPSALTRCRIEDDLVDGHGKGFPKMLTRGGIRRMAKAKRIFTETDRQKLLSAIEQCRKAGIDALRQGALHRQHQRANVGAHRCD